MGTATWPIYCMVTCDDFEVSVAPEFWAAWIRSFVDASRHPSRGDTLGDVYRKAEREYWEKNKSIVKHNAATPPSQNRKEPLSFGTVAAYQGNQSMAALPCWDMVVGKECGATRWRKKVRQRQQQSKDGSSSNVADDGTYSGLTNGAVPTRTVSTAATSSSGGGGGDDENGDGCSGDKRGQAGGGGGLRGPADRSQSEPPANSRL